MSTGAEVPPPSQQPKMVSVPVRRATAEQWAESNLILRMGEAGRDTDNRIVKYGNGVDLWPDLPVYFVGSATGAQGSQGGTGAQGAQGQQGSNKVITRQVKTGTVPAALAGIMATVTITWDTPFPDTNYDVHVTYTGTTGVQLSQPVIARTTGGVTLRLYGLSVLSAAVPVEVVGIRYA